MAEKDESNYGIRFVNRAKCDRVEVVRCKDCIWGEYSYTEFDDYYECRYVGGDWNRENHFCSYGERKDNE